MVLVKQNHQSIFINMVGNVIATMRSPEKTQNLWELENVQLAKLDVLDVSNIEQAIKMALQNLIKLMFW